MERGGRACELRHPARSRRARRPQWSRLLRHPLDGAAGGDPHHDGGKHWTSKNDPEWQTLAAWVNGATLQAAAAPPRCKARIIQTNSAGDNVHIIDPATNKVVGEIVGIEVGHGAAARPTAAVFTSATRPIARSTSSTRARCASVEQVRLSGHPNNISISRDGRRVYVAIREEPGVVDVVDTSRSRSPRAFRSKAPCTTPTSHPTAGT